MKVAVTGASGHIGNYLCKELVKRGAELKVLVHHNKDEFLDLGVQMIHGDVLNKESLEKLFAGVDVVYHLAAVISIDSKDRKRVFDTNVKGTQNVIEECVAQNVKKLVYFSSIHTIKVNNPHDLLDESNPLSTDTNGAYELSKAAAEIMVLEAAKSGLDASILSPTAVIGPYDRKPSYLGQALIKISLNKLPMLTEGGYDFVDMRDVVQAAIQAASHGRKGEKYILSGQWLSLKSLSKTIQEVSGHKTPKLVVPTGLAKVGLPFIHLWAKLTGEHPLYTADSLDILKKSSRNISSQKANRDLAYHARPIQETLKDTLEWFQQNNLA